jgi:hypothetical protein
VYVVTTEHAMLILIMLVNAVVLSERVEIASGRTRFEARYTAHLTAARLFLRLFQPPHPEAGQCNRTVDLATTMRTVLRVAVMAQWVD